MSTTRYQLIYPTECKKVNGYGVYQLFQSVKLHFTPTTNFDIIKYSGRTPIKRQTYEKRGGQRRIYERIALNYNTHEVYKMLITAAMCGKLGTWIGETMDNGGTDFLRQAEKVLDNPDYYFENSVEYAARWCIEHDCGMKTFLDHNPLSPVIYSFMSGELSPYIIGIWNVLFQLDKRVNNGDIISDGVVDKLTAVKPLIKVDRNHYANIVRTVWQSNDLI